MFSNVTRKIFLAVICFTLAFSQVAFAANWWDFPVDWNKVEKISSKSDLAEYLEKKKRSGATETLIPVILTNGLTVSTNELIKLCPASLISYKIISNDGQNMRVMYKAIDYPGTKVANAYLSGDTSRLNQDEWKLYNIAVKIINEAKKQSNWKNQESYIYKEIMRLTTYYTEDNKNHQPRFVTAIGALIDGKANCQGYSDAFYMLGRMMNWEVGRISGTANGGAHMWNTITINKGKANEKTYCVDVTWGDEALTYKNRKKKLNSFIYFNAPIEIMQVTHSWSWDLAPAIQGSIDDNYGYSIWSNLKRTSSAEAGLKLLAKKMPQKNNNWCSVMTPFDERYSEKNFDSALKFFKQELNSLGYKKHFRLHVKKHGKYMFFTADTYGD